MALANESRWFSKSWAVKVIILTVVYFGSAKLGLLMAFLGTSASPVWPPTGVAFAALLLWGFRVWPGIFIGEFIANSTAFLASDFALGPSLWTSASMGVGNTLEAVTCLYLVRRFVGQRDPFCRIKDIVKYVLLGGLVATTVSATIGVTSVCVCGFGQWVDFLYLWWTWWVGDAVGAVIVTPVLYIWYKERTIKWSWRRAVEAVFVFGLMIFITWVAFWAPGNILSKPIVPLEYLIIPTAIWATFRFGRRGGTLSILLVSALAIWCTTQGFGPFILEIPNDSLLLLQFALAVLAISVLILVGSLTERVHIHEELKKSEEEYRQIAENTDDLMLREDLAGNILYSNDAFKRLLGYEKDELFRMNGIELVHPDDVKHIRDRFIEVVKGNTIQNVEFRGKAKDGSYVELSVNASPLFNSEGDVVAVTGTGRDIREYKRFEDALRESEEKYRTLVSTSPDAIVLADLEGNITYASPQVKFLYGLESPQEYIGKKLFEFVQPKDRDKAIGAFEKVLSKGEYRGFISEHPRKGGGTFIGETNATLVRDSEGKPKAFIAVNRDISERKRAEEQRYAHTKFLESMDSVDRIIRQTNIMKDMMGEVLDVVLSIFQSDRAWLLYPCDPNVPTVEVPMERTRPEYPGALATNFAIPMTFDIKDFIEKALASPVPILYEWPHRQKGWDPKDKYKVRSQMVMALYPKTGKTWLFGIHQCSHKKEWSLEEQRLFKEIGRRIADALSSLISLRELRKSEERFRALTENTNDVTVIISQEGTFRYLSPSIEGIYGYKVNEALGRTPKEFIHPRDYLKALEKLKQAMSSPNQSIRVDAFRILHKNGTWLSLEGSVTCMYDQPSVNGIVFNGHDISERKCAEEEREKLIGQLEAQNAELERFAYTVSHDLKSPLFTVKGFIGLLEEDVAQGNTRGIKEDVTRISSAADKMEQLLRELLELSRIGRLVNPSEDVSLNELAEEAVKLISGKIEEKAVRVEISPHLPVIYGDRSRMLEVLQNLIDNAVKYMGNQSQPTIIIGSQNFGQESICYVKDNGIGIDFSHHKKVFGLFEQLDQNVEGSGIGLALVKRIIEVHNGRIWVESDGMGFGSTFYFTVPSERKQKVASFMSIKSDRPTIQSRPEYVH